MWHNLTQFYNLVEYKTPLIWQTFFTYIIDHYNPSVRIINIVSHIIYVVCANFIHKWRDLQFTGTTTRNYRNFSWQFLLALRVFARNLLRGNRRRNTFRISFWCLAWDSNPDFSSNKPTHYLLEHEQIFPLSIFEACISSKLP